MIVDISLEAEKEKVAVKRLNRKIERQLCIKWRS
jgi:hypothetical protein